MRANLLVLCLFPALALLALPAPGLAQETGAAEKAAEQQPTNQPTNKDALKYRSGLPVPRFASLRARHLPPDEADPYAILGVTPVTPLEQIRAAWRQAVIDSHPDRLAARGVPEEALRLAQDRLVAVNRAWEEISRRVAA